MKMLQVIPRNSEKPNEDQQPPQLLRKKDVAGILAVSTRTVDRMVAEGALRKIYVGGRVRFYAREIREFIEQSEV